MKKHRWHFISLIVVLIVIGFLFIIACNPRFMDLITDKIGLYGESRYGDSEYWD